MSAQTRSQAETERASEAWVDPAAGPGEILEELCSFLVELSEGELTREALDPGVHIFDHGYVDSLSAVMFLDHLLERYGVELEDTELVERLHTLEAIAAHVHSAR